MLLIDILKTCLNETNSHENEKYVNLLSKCFVSRTRLGCLNVYENNINIRKLIFESHFFMRCARKTNTISLLPLLTSKTKNKRYTQTFGQHDARVNQEETSKFISNPFRFGYF